MRVVASLAVLVMLVACGTSPEVKNQRVEYWQRKLAHDLHIGMPKSEIDAWAESNHLKFTLQYSKSRPQLVTFAEEVPGSFSPLTGCKGWHIMIYLFLSESDLLTRYLVRDDAICL